MSSPITLTSATRSSLLSLQSTQSLQDTISERLSTGKKVNSALDNPVNYFTASSLNSRSSQLSDLLDGMSNGIQTIQAASKGIDGMKSLVQQMQSTVKQARQDTTYNSTDATPNTKVRDNLKAQYLDLAKQIDTLAKDSGYNGVNLLNGEELKVVFNEKTGDSKSDMSVSLKNDAGTKEAVNADKLGIAVPGTATTDPYTLPTAVDDFTDSTKLDTLSDLLTTALTSLSTKASSLGSSLSVVQTRQDFTKQIVNVLKTGSDNLVNADMNEEAANFTALQTRQSIAQQTLSLANQQQQGILQLLR